MFIALQNPYPVRSSGALCVGAVSLHAAPNGAGSIRNAEL
jgi:hypothetical protein